MKTKILILATIISIIDINLSSQNISVDLSIIWIESQCIHNSDSLVYYPMLRMSYTNNSNNNYYFRKFSHDKNGLKYQGCYELSQYREIDTTWNYTNYLREMECKKLFENHEYIVHIDLPYLYYGHWYTDFPNFYDINKRNSPDINCVISNINNCIDKYVLNNDDNDDNDKEFSSSDLTEYAIIENVDNQFLFLKAGETKKELYNLTSYYMVKGTYTFILNDSVFSDNVLSGWVTDGNKIFLPLPKKVGKYKLYSGKFTANTLTVTF